MADLKQMYRRIMDDHFPDAMTITFDDQKLVYRKRTWKIRDETTGELIEKGLRYGENPDQESALYELVNGNLILGECAFIEPGHGLVSSIREGDLLQFGKHPGKINLTDIDNALNIMKFLTERPAAVIMKHNNPCGVAYGHTLAEAYERANMADRIAAFGGCAAFNRTLDKTTAEMIRQNYLEVVVAPEFAEGAVSTLKGRKNLRIVQIKRIDRLQEFQRLVFVDFKSLIDGGIIVQRSPVNRIIGPENFLPAVATYQGKEYRIERSPTPQEEGDMLFGWSVEQGITSNSVIYVKGGVTIGIGTGEQDRVGVAEIAILKAYTKCADALCFKVHGIPIKRLEAEIDQGTRPASEKEAIDALVQEIRAGLKGAVMVSDAFFPFRDGVDVAIRQGVTAIIQPGGSERDWEVIQACNEARPLVSMVFTGQRAFKH
jgi:phosphoribosylaminoimidazolecarboxamide formyltransferase/IMP cyclohydrolase